MRSRELPRMVAQASKLTPAQRHELVQALSQTDEDRWERQAEVLRQGLSVHQAAEVLAAAPSTAFRWRHRFLQLPQGLKAATLQGVVEADETYFLRPSKGQRVQARKARRRGGSAAKRGLSEEQEPVQVVRDRSGGGLHPGPCRQSSHGSDSGAGAGSRHGAVHGWRRGAGSGGPAARSRAPRLEPLQGPGVQGAWHIQNVNAHHGRLKGWMCRFKGVASSYLASYRGWLRALDQSAQNARQPAPFLAMAVGV